MKNADLPAMPITLNEVSCAFVNEVGDNAKKIFGLTKREMFAMAAMQGLLSGTDGDSALFDNAPEWVRNIAEASVEFSDALLAELERTK